MAVAFSSLNVARIRIASLGLRVWKTGVHGLVSVQVQSNVHPDTSVRTINVCLPVNVKPTVIVPGDTGAWITHACLLENVVTTLTALTAIRASTTHVSSRVVPLMIAGRVCGAIRIAVDVSLAAMMIRTA